MRPSCLPWRNAGYSFSWQSAKFYKIYGTLKLIWESMRKLKCGISRKQLIVERNWQKFGTEGTTVHIFRELWRHVHSLSLIWGQSLHFTNISNFIIFKTPLPVFIRISSKLYVRHHDHGAMQAIVFFWWSAKNFKKYGILKFFLTQDHM